jgi:hypothetical protein
MQAALLLVFTFSAFAPSKALAQVAATAAVDSVAVLTNPPVTGSFDDLRSPLWQHALRVSDFQNVTIRKPAADKTEVLLVFGPDAVYCAFVSEQLSAPIMAKQTVNGVGLGLDDYVSLMFDTSGNGTNQYFFETTPAGVRYQQASESTRYNPAWTAFSRVEGKRWLAELVVPYRFLRGSSKAWRLNFARNIAESQQLYTWAYDAQMNNPFTESFWPTLRNAPAIAARVPKPTAEIYGLGSAGRDAHVFEGAAGEFDTAHGRSIGIDAKIPLTASLNFDGTLNPDFSNLESDQQVIAPQEFRFQFAEYRPFFTQGANYLPGNEVFYSPSIGIFDHGEKIEGQVGHFGIGLLNVGAFGSSDRAFALQYNAPNQETAVGLYGAQADRLTGDDNVAELVVANTNLVSHINYGASTAVESGATTPDSSAAHRSSVFAGISKANYSVQAAYYDIGPDYHPTDAFIAQSDIRGPQVSASLSSTTNATAAVRQVSISGYSDRYLDRSGDVHEADSGVTGAVTFKDLLSVSLSQSLSSLREYVVPFPVYAGGVTFPFDQTTVAASYRAGTPDTVSAAYSWGPFGGFFLQQLSGSISHRFSRRYSAEFDYGAVDERDFTGLANGQILRRLSIFGSLSPDETMSIAYRVIQGTGGFSVPGRNVALGYYHRFGKGNTLQAEIGSPAASRTLDRYIIKYVILVGSGAGE